MAPNFSKNAILKGDIDFFCLVCESFFRSTNECVAHVSKPNHRKNFASISYVEEFKKDCIRKIDKRYFCELCNKLMALDKVKFHVKDQSHIEMKDVGWIKRVANLIVAFDEILINELAWNGLADNTCVICNDEYHDEEVHKNLSTHIINLLQLKVEFDENKNIFRKINDAKFHCLTCNMLQNLSNMTTHFESDTHKEMYDMCRDTYLPVRKDFEVFRKVHKKLNSPGQVINENASTSGKQQDAIPKAKEVKGTDALNKPLMKAGTSKTEDEAAKPADVSDACDANNNGSTEKIRESFMLPEEDEPEDDPKYVYDDKWEDRICKVLEASDYISQDDNNRPLCILCDWIIDTSKVRDHLYGKHHQRLKKLHKERLEKLKEKYKREEDDKHKKKLEKLKEKNKHKEDDKHKERVEKLKDKNKHEEDDKNKERLEKLKEKNKPEEDDKNNKLLDSVNEFQDNDIKINFEMKTAMCKKCSLYLDYDYDAIKNHISGHNKEKAKRDDKENVKIELNYQKKSENKGTLFSSPVVLKQEPVETDASTANNNNNNDDESNEAMAANVEEEEDQATKNVAPQNTEQPNECTLERVSIRVFIQNIISIRNVIFSDVIINNRICINNFSFLFVTYMYDRASMRCHACNEVMTFRNCNIHCGTNRHEQILNNARVISQLDSEFVRELRPGNFHCGFCNILELSWSAMEAHLASATHNQIKSEASFRLRRYQTGINRERHNRRVAETIAADMIQRNYI